MQMCEILSSDLVTIFANVFYDWVFLLFAPLPLNFYAASFCDAVLFPVVLAAGVVAGFSVFVLRSCFCHCYVCFLRPLLCCISHVVLLAVSSFVDVSSAVFFALAEKMISWCVIYF